MNDQVGFSLVENFTRKRYQWEFEVRVYQNEIDEYSIYISVSDCNRPLYQRYHECDSIAKLHLLSERKKTQVISKLDQFIDTYIKSKNLPTYALLREIDESQAMSDGLGRSHNNNYHCDCCSSGRTISFYQSTTHTH